MTIEIGLLYQFEMILTGLKAQPLDNKAAKIIPIIFAAFIYWQTGFAAGLALECCPKWNILTQ